MECPNCKTQNDDENKFCRNCGTILEPPKIEKTAGSQDFWEKYLPFVGTGLGIGSGLITLMGWFTPFTTLDFGNGPQLIALPFGLSKLAKSFNSAPLLSMAFSSANEITGWVLLASIALSITSIVLVILSLMSAWVGVKCLENRAEPAAMYIVKSEINKLRNYSLTGSVLVVLLMVFVSLAQVGEATIGNGLITMAFGFLATFLVVIYLKPHLR